ncbi:hypothetical protein PF005_g839 [Phytophthora fragariae]|uniref:WRKY19-like zinc finger domain-containing protein n=1 Tax=Phytophthora fragariae TaxID=53985 RepID=A0A6A3ZJ48_9STRA|nr:hypothetical protein PF005_g839 [Phytophthora fragariae]
MEAEEEAREVATASAALFDGAEGEPRFDDEGMDGSDLPPSFAMPLLARGDEDNAAEGEAAAAATRGAVSAPPADVKRGQERAASSAEASGEASAQSPAQPQETTQDQQEQQPHNGQKADAAPPQAQDEAEAEAADRRGYQCRFESCPKFAQAGGLCIAHGGGYRCQTPFCAFFNLRTCPDHGGSKRCGVAGCTRVAMGSSALCCAHGGGRKCSKKKCDKSRSASGVAVHMAESRGALLQAASV